MCGYREKTELNTKTQRGIAATEFIEMSSGGVFPSWDRRGGRAIKKMPRSLV